MFFLVARQGRTQVGGAKGALPPPGADPGGGFWGSWPPPALDHQFCFSTNFLTSQKKKIKKNRSEYSMDAMYLNLMFINPRPPVGADAKGARSTRPSLTPPAKNPGSAPAPPPSTQTYTGMQA